MPNIDHFLYKNSIFKILRLWEHGHFVDILGIKHQIHGKVIFVMSFIFTKINKLCREKKRERKKNK
jgi:hypothetical protein